jgi:hypothetical protein
VKLSCPTVIYISQESRTQQQSAPSTTAQISPIKNSKCHLHKQTCPELMFHKISICSDDMSSRQCDRMCVICMELLLKKMTILANTAPQHLWTLSGFFALKAIATPRVNLLSYFMSRSLATCGHTSCKFHCRYAKK